MKTVLAGMTLLSAASGAEAQTIELDPALEARARYEHVEQAGLARAADAVTLRLRPSVTARLDRWSALIEGEAVVAAVQRYNDGLNGRSGFPTVADPENLELNRAQIGYAAPGLVATAGRQRITLADERFVGTATWRQSEQTFDAVRVAIGRPAGLSLDASYVRSARTVNGRNGFGTRPTSIAGESFFALLTYGAKVGAVTGFAYLVDQDDAAVQGIRLSSQTYGARLTGGMPVGGAKLAYAGSWAVQRDYRRNPNRYTADYLLGEVSLVAKGAIALGGYEMLGAARGAALTSVQTPFASAFKFNGWAGKFTTTPPDGLHDRYLTTAFTLPRPTPLGVLSLGATWHDFVSARARRRYGSETDLLATIKRGSRTFAVRYAHYEAAGFATDTDKVWLQLDLAI